MLTSTTQKLSVRDLLKAYLVLGKFKLTLFVAFSASFGYVMAATEVFSWFTFLIVTVAGAMITGGANALNQVFEREWDAMMKRTEMRPLPTQQISVASAVIYSLVLGITGIGLIGYYCNLVAALLGIIGYLSYAFVYTPLKRISPFSVFVGAIPGALPPLIGWVAVTGKLDAFGWMLFAFQFFWQFPHFWAIAWLADEDYTKAGFKMLPSHSGKSHFSASLIMYYTICLIPLSFMPYFLRMIDLWQVIALLTLAVYFLMPAIRLSRSLDNQDARKLMFASFFYLPLMQLTFLLGIWLF